MPDRARAVPTVQNMNLFQKLVEIRKAVPYLQQVSQGHEYKYVGSSQVLYSIREKMDELGVLLVPGVVGHNLQLGAIQTRSGALHHFTEVDMEYTFINADNPNETLSRTWYGQGIDNSEKGIGKAYTYAEKYFILKFFNIPTDKDDPDGFQSRFDDEAVPQSQNEAAAGREQKQATNGRGGQQGQRGGQSARPSRITNGNKNKIKEYVAELVELGGTVEGVLTSLKARVGEFGTEQAPLDYGTMTMEQGRDALPILKGWIERKKQQQIELQRQQVDPDAENEEGGAQNAEQSDSNRAAD